MSKTMLEEYREEWSRYIAVRRALDAARECIAFNSEPERKCDRKRWQELVLALEALDKAEAGDE